MEFRKTYNKKTFRFMQGFCMIIDGFVLILSLGRYYSNLNNDFIKKHLLK